MKRQPSYQVPELEHLQNAVDAVKRGLIPQIQKQPQQDTEKEELSEQAETGPEEE
jgi:hypothetical protein